MKAFLGYAMIVAASALVGSGAAVAGGNCGMNSNTPCPEKHSAKEPAYGMNSNKPKPQQASDTPARADVQAKADEGKEAEGKAATLSGVSASDLKVKPAPPKSSEKEKPR